MIFSPGIFPIYKPVGITSHDVIDKLRRLTGIKKIGHAGTLDPLASGVLLVAIGREYTKQLDQLMLGEKEYIADITLGVTSTTEDAEGEKTEHEVNNIPNFGEVQHVVQKWIGVVDQIPPIYSAIKIQGKPAHRRVRSGQELTMSSRKVEIFSIQILKYEWPLLQIKVRCAKGVYIRSLARDIGEGLSTGAYMSGLVRTKVGEYTIEQAYKLE